MKRNIVRWTRASVAALGLTVLSPAAASAYGGPGSVVSGIGALLAVVAVLFASILGFIWYPVKRLGRWLWSARTPHGRPDGESTDGGT